MLSCRKSSCASFPSWKHLLLFPIGSHRGWNQLLLIQEFGGFLEMISDPETDSPFRDQSDSGSCLSPTPPSPSPPPTPTPHTAFSLVYRLCLLIKQCCFVSLRVLWKRSSFLWYCCARIWKGPGNGYVCSSLLELACVYVRIRVPRLTCERALLNWLRRKHSRIQSTRKGPEGFCKFTWSRMNPSAENNQGQGMGFMKLGRSLAWSAIEVNLFFYLRRPRIQ